MSKKEPRQEAQQTQQAEPPQPITPVARDEFDDDIPFSMKTLTIILALALTGCSALEHKLMMAENPLLIPPNVIQPTVCENQVNCYFVRMKIY